MNLNEAGFIAGYLEKISLAGIPGKKIVTISYIKHKKKPKLADKIKIKKIKFG